MKRKTNNIIVASFALTVLVLSGCAPEAPVQRDWEQYGNQLLQQLSSSTVLPEYEPSLNHYPERRELRLPLSDIRIGFTNFMQVGKCDLQELIAWRNSGAGRIMAESQVLLYEHQFFVKLEECLKQRETWLAGQDKFIARMQEVREIKQQELPVAFWNATFASREFRTLFFLTNKPLPLFENPVRRQRVNDAILFLQDVGERLGDASLQLQSRPFEKRYYELQKDEYGGQLLRSMDILTFYLNALNAEMQLKLSQTKSDSLHVASGVSTLYSRFTSELLPYAERVHQEAEQLLGNVNQLMQRQESLLPDSFATFYKTYLDLQTPTSLWNRYDRALQTHKRLWEAILNPAVSMPQEPA